MKHQVGDIVTIKTREFFQGLPKYYKDCDDDTGKRLESEAGYADLYFAEDMLKYAGAKTEIKKVWEHGTYALEIDREAWEWSDECFEEEIEQKPIPLMKREEFVTEDLDEVWANLTKQQKQAIIASDTFREIIRKVKIWKGELVVCSNSQDDLAKLRNVTIARFWGIIGQTGRIETNVKCFNYCIRFSDIARILEQEDTVDRSGEYVDKILSASQIELVDPDAGN